MRPISPKDGGKTACGGVREGRRRFEGLQATRGAEAEALAHHQREVVGGGVNQHAFWTRRNPLLTGLVC